MKKKKTKHPQENQNVKITNREEASKQEICSTQVILDLNSLSLNK